MAANRETKNVMIVGVGGQGSLLASKLLGHLLLSQGYDVKVSEVHGMSQRGGSVSTQVRFGEKVDAPIIGKGQADVIVAFEKMEALRALPYLKKEGKMVVNDFEIPSMPILSGAAVYPEGILEELSANANVLAVKAAEIAEGLGNPKAMNIVLLGALVKAMNVEGIDWEKAVRENVKKGFEELNIKAFNAGYAL